MAPTLSTSPSIERVEYAFTVPSDVPEDVFARGEAIAEANACGAKATVLPAGTRVRAVEEDGVRRLFVSRALAPTGLALDKGDVASLGGTAEKGTQSPSVFGGLALVRGPETEFTCACQGGPQNQSTGCTPAYNPETGHTYCDAYGNCQQCRMIIG